MGLDSLISSVLTKYKADTSDHKAAVKSLRGEQKKYHQDLLAESESQNRAIDKQIAMWGKIAVGIGATVAAYQVASRAAKAYLEDVRLKSAAAGANVDGLRKATRGLIEEDTLLAFAGKAQAGVWKLNQREMETVLRGADALRKKMGVELAPTIDKLTEALAKGSTRALKEFGIEAKDKEGALRQLDALFRGLGGNTELAGDKMQAAGVKMADTFDDLQGELGRLVLELTPAIEALATFVAGIADAVQWTGKLTDRLLGVDSGGGSATQQRLRQAKGMRAEAKKIRGSGGSLEKSWWEPGSGLFGVGGDPDFYLAPNAKASQLESQAQYLELYATTGSGGGAEARAAAMKLMEAARAVASFAGAVPTVGQAPGKGGKGGRRGPALEYSLGSAGPGREDAPGYGAGPGVDINAVLAGGTGLLDQRDASEAALRSQRDGEAMFLESMFGPVDQFKVYATAFDMLAGASGAAFEAWITGADSAGGAAAKFVAEGLKAAAVQMQMEAIKHAAFAIGDFAFGNFPGAAAHAKAAAAFSAGAIVTGVAAKQLGKATGQWSQGASSGGGQAPSVVGSGGSRGGGSDGNAPVIVYVGSEWAGLSPIEQSGAIVRAIQLGKRGSTHIRRD